VVRFAERYHSATGLGNQRHARLLWTCSESGYDDRSVTRRRMSLACLDLDVYMRQWRDALSGPGQRATINGQYNYEEFIFRAMAIGNAWHRCQLVERPID